MKQKIVYDISQAIAKLEHILIDMKAIKRVIDGNSQLARACGSLSQTIYDFQQVKL